LIHYRSETETLIECVADQEITCAQGTFRLRVFLDTTSGDTHLALSHGEMSADQETLVRVHEAVSVLDFLGVQNTRHSFSIDFALRQIAASDRGVIVMLHHAQSTQDMLMTLQANSASPKAGGKWDPRLYGIGAQILRDLGVGKMRLMSNPRKMPSMAGFGLEICGYFVP
jgi:3,4-dihydroxy 2-butanone 4-phosphate synthase/GTP cyclohydrolase II